MEELKKFSKDQSDRLKSQIIELEKNLGLLQQEREMRVGLCPTKPTHFDRSHVTTLQELMNRQDIPFKETAGNTSPPTLKYNEMLEQDGIILDLLDSLVEREMTIKRRPVQVCFIAHDVEELRD
jgi:hypothetical protein